MVRIVQLLCPERHCLVAVPYEDDRCQIGEVKEMLQAMMGRGEFNNWCGICGSQELHYEDGATGFQTLQEAAPFLLATERDNFDTRRSLDEAGLSFDKRRQN